MPGLFNRQEQERGCHSRQPLPLLLRSRRARPFPSPPALAVSSQRGGGSLVSLPSVPLLLTRHVASLIPVLFPLQLSRGSSRAAQSCDCCQRPSKRRLGATFAPGPHCHGGSGAPQWHRCPIPLPSSWSDFHLMCLQR